MKLLLFARNMTVWIPFLNIGLYNIALLIYARVVETKRKVETLVTQMVHMHLDSSGVMITVGRMTLRQIQGLCYLGLLQGTSSNKKSRSKC